jgi:hypothetical protein
MNHARFESAPRCTAAGLTSAATLVVMLAMGASTLPLPQSNSAGAAPVAGTAPLQVVQAPGSAPIRKS